MRILNVDDNENNLYMVEVLFNAKGNSVLSARNGAEALDALENEPFDLIISDILMPEVDGWQLCYEVRTNEKWKHIPFIFYTATYTSKKDEEFAIKLGASRFIVKPEEPDIFLKIVNSIAEESRHTVFNIPKLEYNDELRYIKAHNERLVNKLSQKVGQLEKTNRDLQKAIAEKDTEISERKQAERSVKKSEILYRSLFDNMLNGFAYCKMLYEDKKPPDFIYITVNKAFEKQTGLKNVTGKKVSEVIPGIQETDPELLKRYERVAVTRIPEAFEIYVESLKMWFSISVYSPELDYFVAVFDVITERKLAEETLRQSEERLRHAAVAAGFGTYSYNFNTGKMYNSPEHLALYGLPPDAVIELDDDLTAKALYSEDKEMFLAAMKGANNSDIKNSGILDIEFRIKRNDGELHWLKARGRTIFDTGGQPLRADGIVLDITERKLAEEALYESQEQYRLLFENSFDGVFLSVPDDGTILSVNPAGCRMFGRTEKEILKIGRAGILDVTELRFKEGLVSRMKQGHFIGELTGIKGNGERFPVEVTSLFYLDHKNRQRASAIIRDISERKKTEEKIKKLNRIYAVLSEINKAIVRIDDQQELFETACKIAVETGSFAFCWIGIVDAENNRVTPAAQYGYSERYLETIQISLSSDKKEGRGLIGTTAREKKYHICNDIENDGEKLRWREEDLKRGFRSSAAFPLIISGNTFGVIVFYSFQTDSFDVEEIRLLEELSSDISYCIYMLHREEQKRQIEKERDRFFNYSLDMMCIIGFDGFFKQLNPAWTKTLGWTTEELFIKPFFEIVYPDDQKAAAESGRKLMKNDQIITNYLNRILCRNGTYKWISWNLVTIPDEKNIFAVARDVTERIESINKQKSLEAQLVQAQKLESLGTMAGGIAHDFNNILNIIMGYASILKSSDYDMNELQKDAVIILDAGKRGAGLVKQLLTFARKTESIFQPVQVNDIVSEIEILLKATFPKTLEINCELQEKLPRVTGDTTQLHQVFLNLCVNAKDAMSDTGTLTLSTRYLNRKEIELKNTGMEPGEYIQVQVKDTGTGIDESIRQKIFDPFFTTKAAGKGTGLGLALVYGIIKNHGGAIDLTSEMGKGTSFYIYLPVQKNSEEINSGLRKSDDDIQKGTGTVLIIEDEKQFSELLTKMLVSNGYKVIVSSDGLQGIAAYQKYKNEVAVVISDIGLPKLGGEEVYKQIIAGNPEAKIILISGFIDPEVKARLQEAGARYFVQKPFLPAEIMSAIKHIIEEQAHIDKNK